jgi:hypothetical protein
VEVRKIVSNTCCSDGEEQEKSPILQVWAGK